MNNHYQTLKVSRDAPPEVIRMAYKVLCQKYHPDKYPENRAAAEQIMKALNAAYAVLSDPAKRKDYDDFLDEAEAINEDLNHSGTGQQSQKPKAEPNQETRQNTYNYKAKAKPKPNDFNHGTDNTPRPWRRFFARNVDYFFAAFLVVFFIGYFRQLGLLSQKTSILLINPFIQCFIAYFLWIFMESALLSWFGNTPGKMLFGLRVVSSQQPPRYLNRAFSVWFRGIGLGLPFVWLITASLAHSRLKKTGLTSWDKDYGFTVEAYPIGVIHRTVAAGIILALFAASLLVGKEHRTSLAKPVNQYKSEEYNQKPSYAQMSKSLDDSKPTSNLQDPLDVLLESYKTEDNGVSQNNTEVNKTSKMQTAKSGPTDAETQFKWGQAYSKGDGVPKNYPEAAKWYRMAAEQGDALAQNNLAELYFDGKGVKQDYVEAVKWFRKAAEQGLSYSQVSMGWVYMNGLGGLPIDYQQAVYWNKLGAQQGHQEGYNNLGWLFENGLGVEKNYQIAASLYQEAAKQGNQEATKRLENLISSKKVSAEKGYKPTIGKVYEPMQKNTNSSIPIVDETPNNKFSYNEEKISLNFQNIPIISALRILADFSNLNFVVTESVKGSVTMQYNDIPWDQALDIILKSNNLGQRRDGNTIYIMTLSELNNLTKKGNTIKLGNNLKIETATSYKFTGPNGGKAEISGDINAIKKDMQRHFNNTNVDPKKAH